MVRIGVWRGVSVLLVCCVLPMAAQQQTNIEANVVVPPYVNFSGGLTDVNGKPMTLGSLSFCTRTRKAALRCGWRLRMSIPTSRDTTA